MSETRPRVPMRAPRAAMFAAVCVALAAVGHAHMSGADIPLPWLLGAFAATAALAWTAAGRRCGPLGITASLLAVQAALHVTFSAAQGHTHGAPAPMAGHHHPPTHATGPGATHAAHGPGHAMDAAGAGRVPGAAHVRDVAGAGSGHASGLVDAGSAHALGVAQVGDVAGAGFGHAPGLADAGSAHSLADAVGAAHAAGVHDPAALAHSAGLIDPAGLAHATGMAHSGMAHATGTASHSGMADGMASTTGTADGMAGLVDLLGMAGHGGFGMVAAHLLAGLFCALWLAWGEAAVFRLAGALGATALLAARPLARVLALLRTRPAPVPGPPAQRPSYRPPRRLRGAVHAHTAVRRGPPRRRDTRTTALRPLSARAA
ncbi:hypothetical protein [Streptomyces sp. NPDC058157]|uniref:hypothetical protein n=1 Tax=Streptomyces sp. NPDC058157 TaxID=3346360 RepID=UPI0036F0D4AE